MVLAGDLVTGILTASYGGYQTAILETWKLTTPEEWRLMSPAPPPCPMSDLDFNEATVEGLPVLGGSGFHYEGEARILGVRLAPPPQDPHLFHLDRKKKKEEEEDEEEEKQKQSADPSVERKKSKTRERRGRSLARYTRFNTNTSRRRR